VTSNRREKQLARDKYERQAARREESAITRHKRQRIIAGIVVAVLVIAAGVWLAIGRSGSTDEPVAEANPSASAAPSDAAASPASSGTLACTEPVATRADDLTYDAAPPASALSEQTATITLNTNCGPITITTLPDAAPQTVASEVFLAQQGFYDKTKCHRLTTSGIYVLQCGDPKGDGTGGPGYAVPDENLPTGEGVNYPAGTVAMANAGAGTSGSQFFLVYQDTTLPAGYTIWGTVTEGLDLLQQVATAGAEGGSGDGAPLQPVVIETVTVTAS
jgi:peptidyl-prolyl cis-trans isomerase B (cyclophilin B)